MAVPWSVATAMFGLRLCSMCLPLCLAKSPTGAETFEVVRLGQDRSTDVLGVVWVCQTTSNSYREIICSLFLRQACDLTIIIHLALVTGCTKVLSLSSSSHNLLDFWTGPSWSAS